MIKNLLLVAGGGGLGAAARYLVSLAFRSYATGPLPWATLLVNVLGSFLIGLSFELVTGRVMSDNMRQLAAVGFLGAFTTFSTFSLESINLYRQSGIAVFLLNVGLNNMLAIGAVVLGLYLGKIVVR